ncbi:MAG: peptidase M14 [Pirellulaceae bacterium]|nr:MAG: peptidase M14 [Pirellulaceae bacterium]
MRLDADPWTALPESDYRANVPTPEEYFGNGFRAGKRPLAYHELVSYLDELARRSPRVTPFSYATSYGGRVLRCYIFTSPANHRRLERIREARAAWCDPNNSVASPPDPPLAVYLAFSVHGNEASGANAAPLVAYYLAAARSPRVSQLLDRCVVLLDPCLNPDGYDRFVQWVNAASGRLPSSDPYAREHREPWPTGRTNYYWFDLNRDWLPAQHPETRGRLRLLAQWKPNALFDFHEMGTPSTFFLQPGVPSRTNPLIPQENVLLTEKISYGVSRQLDMHGVLHFTREQFDDFYPGKGSTYVDFTGGIGILFEQGTTRGAVRRTELGEMTFGYTVRNQVAAAVGALDSVIQHETALVQYQRQFYCEGMASGKRSPARAYIASAPGDPARAAAFEELLELHGINYQKLSNTVIVNERQFSLEDSILIPTEQPNFRLLQAMLEERTEFEDDVFYDVSAWNPFHAFGLEVYPLTNEVVTGEPKSVEDAATPAVDPGERHDWDEVRYVVIDWRSYFGPKVLWKLLENGVITLVARNSFSVQQGDSVQVWPPGTLILPLQLVDGSLDKVPEVLAEARQDHVKWQALRSARVVEGPDFGSSRYVALQKPRVALLAGTSIEASPAGELWYLLDYRMGIPVTVVDPVDADSVHWSVYSVVAMPPGDYGRLSPQARERLSRWVEQGGTLVSMGRAALILPGGSWAENELFIPPSEAGPPAGGQPAARRFGSGDRIPGTILTVNGVADHPLLYGLRLPMKVMRTDELLLRGGDLADTPLVYSGTPLVSGYLPEAYQRALPNTAAARVVRRGRGVIVVLMDSVAFRGYWYGTDRLFLNAVFFGQLMR